MSGSEPKKVSVISMVIVPAIITLVVCIARLVGELVGGPAFLFGDEAGGGGSLLGISWLIPVFGIVFALQLSKRGYPSKGWKTVGLVLFGLAVGFGGIGWMVRQGMMVVPDAAAAVPVEPKGMEYLLVWFGVAGLMAWIAWPRLAWTLFVYSVLARIPVVIITWLAINQGWDTHYVKPPPGVPKMADDELFVFLATPQLSMWLMGTVSLGAFAGAIAAALADKRS